MTISRDVPIHGTGHTVGEILDAASYTLPAATGSVLGGVKIGSGVTASEDGTISVAGGGDGGGSPQAGQPTRFLTLTYHHPGNEDGNSESATTGILVPDSATTLGTLWKYEYQIQVVNSSNAADKAQYYGVGTLQSYDNSGAVFADPTPFNAQSNFALNTGEYANDANFRLTSMKFRVDGIYFVFNGLTSAHETVWTFNVQLTPIAP